MCIRDRAEFLKERCIREYNLGEKISSIWIAPQERFMLPTIQKIFAKYNTPVAAIDMRTFGTMNGAKALALSLIHIFLLS